MKHKHPLVAYLKAEKLSVVWLAKQINLDRGTLARQMASGAPMVTKLAVQAVTNGAFPVGDWPGDAK